MARIMARKCGKRTLCPEGLALQIACESAARYLGFAGHTEQSGQKAGEDYANAMRAAREHACACGAKGKGA